MYSFLKHQSPTPVTYFFQQGHPSKPTPRASNWDSQMFRCLRLQWTSCSIYHTYQSLFPLCSTFIISLFCILLPHMFTILSFHEASVFSLPLMVPCHLLGLYGHHYSTGSWIGSIYKGEHIAFVFLGLGCLTQLNIFQFHCFPAIFIIAFFLIG